MTTVVHLLCLSTLKGVLSLRAQGLRAGASVLGLALAVASVMIIVSIGAGARQTVRDLVALEGVNIIYVLSAVRNVRGVRVVQQTRSSLTVEDALALKSSIPQLKDICWWRQDPSRVVAGPENLEARVLSVSPGCQSVKGWWPESGSEISQANFDAAESVAVLGQTVKQRLFGDLNPIGRMIRIRNVPFQVIGVLEWKGFAPGGYDQDDIVLIPYSTSKYKLLGATMSYVEVIAAATFHREELSAAAESMKELFRIRHQIQPGSPDDVLIRTQLEVEKFYEETSETMTMFLAIIASIALLVGGVGIMNVLLVSVTERTREIGVRMAVGATRRHILMQFLIEAMTLSLAGGCIGILFGVLGARMTTVLAGWPTIISGNTVAAAVVFSVAVGLFFGVYPANKASRLNPIDALRYE